MYVLFSLSNSCTPDIPFKVEKLYLNPPSWYAEQRPDQFRYHLSEAVTSLSPENQQVHTSKGRSIRYDKCILATGSTPALPPFTSREKVAKTRGIFEYRDISDLDAIIQYAEEGGHSKRAVIVGGGLLGLEAAKAMSDLELYVQYLERSTLPFTILFTESPTSVSYTEGPTPCHNNSMQKPVKWCLTKSNHLAYSFLQTVLLLKNSLVQLRVALGMRALLALSFKTGLLLTRTWQSTPSVSDHAMSWLKSVALHATREEA